MNTENKRGGKREGAGRPRKEASEPVRVPLSLIPLIKNIVSNYRGELPDDMMTFAAASSLQIPLAAEGVQAGFPSPATPYISNYLDFNEYLVQNPAATIAVRVKGESMRDAGMEDGDLLVVDRSLEALHRDIVIAEVDNEFTVKRLIRTLTGIELHPENPDYPIIKPRAGSTVNLVGVVLYTIKKTR